MSEDDAQSLHRGTGGGTYTRKRIVDRRAERPAGAMLTTGAITARAAVSAGVNRKAISRAGGSLALATQQCRRSMLSLDRGLEPHRRPVAAFDDRLGQSLGFCVADRAGGVSLPHSCGQTR